MSATYSCPGLDLPTDEVIPCCRAGHACKSVSHVEVTDTHRITTNRCGCCGQFYGQIAWLLAWDSEVPA